MSFNALSPRDWMSRPVESAVVLAILAAAALSLPDLLRWAVLDATWTGTSREACREGGACWAFVTARFGQFLYGFYPEPERWRVDLSAVWLLALLVVLSVRFGGRARRTLALVLGLPFPVGVGLLLAGGVPGLPAVETRLWGGLMLTVVMTLGAGAIAVPLGILLALGRRSRLPLISRLSVVFIEFWRGVPILSVIFLASVLLPLVMPQGVTVDRLVRAVVGLGLVVSAYMAEVVRGGLQALPKGQYEAAQALGLGYWRMALLVVLPQALRTVLPGLTNEAIALLKNTTLVLIVSLFELLGIVQAALADPKWVGLTTEGYVFAGLTFWLLCFSISRYARWLEDRLAIPGRR